MRQMVVRVGEEVIRLRQVSHVCPPAPPVENRGLRSTIRRWPRSSRYSFWEFRAQDPHSNFTTTISSAACKLSYIGLDVPLQYEVSKNSVFWNINRDAWKPPQRGRIDSDADYCRTPTRWPSGSGCPDCAGLRGPQRYPFRGRGPF